MSDNRDFVMARICAARGQAALAAEALDEAAQFFVGPSEDSKGSDRTNLLDIADEAFGEGARAVQAAQELIDDIDFNEEEPDLPEGDGHDDPGEGNPDQ